MNCTRLRSVLDAHLDDEVDRATADEVTQHLAACVVCAQLKDERTTLRQWVRAEAPYYTAPTALKATLRKSLRVSSQTEARPARGLSWLQAGAIAATAALVSATAGFWLGQPPQDDPLREQVVASHVASLAEPRRLIDVVSSDRHTVKPWFQGKVDFSPAVKDLSAAGFVLVGGRVDHVGERPAAAIVYRIRDHVINLYIWRATSGAAPLAEMRTRGFALETWAEDGLRYAAISDVDPRDLQRFATLVRER
ncbi:MAG TPA: anti-sigma factor [Burkholderiales bacterium]|nr:anti-sigma factor [Burkholderiales bacterium]